jgi:4-hydroxythreonine-4-phosphate dehydrogenase
MKSLRIGITIGDINGIGPEIVLKALRDVRWPAHVRFTLHGSEAVLRRLAPRLGLATIPADIQDALLGTPLSLRTGRVDARAGAAAAAWIRAGACACLHGRHDALVTAPISKEALHAAGLNIPGHTEMLAGLSGAKRFAMMLIGGPLRVVIATRHLPLRSVPNALTPALLREQIEITLESLPWAGCRKARVAVCGLNPHAGEGGVLGHEEARIIAPVVQAFRRRGRRVTGPLSADTVFHRAAEGDFDAVVAMYHDQGLAPLKLLAFRTGVNVTLGLPFVRTSPDHGTAFDLAGRNRADPSSMIEAIRQAVFLAGRPLPRRWRRHPCI